MKRTTLTLLCVLFVSTGALASGDTGHAHDDHNHDHAEGSAHDHAPKHGGVVSEAHDMDFELVVSDGRVRLYLRDHGDTVKPDGGHVKLTVVSKDGIQHIELAPAAGHFESKGEVKLSAGARVVARVTMEGQTMAVRFLMP